MRLLSIVVLIVFLSKIYGQSSSSTTSRVSYNQPRFCSNASWDPNGITFRPDQMPSSTFYNVFIDINNNIGITALNGYSIRYQLTFNLKISKLSILSGLKGLFATEDGTIYISNTNNDKIEKTTWDSWNKTTVLNPSQECSGLFIDINNTLYCSIESQHKIISTSLKNISNKWIVVAGNGTSGFGLKQLSSPNGIFVSINFSLYVADRDNDRIQLFTIGYLNGKTLIGNNTSVSKKLSGPTGIILDADYNLYITDSNNNRIVVFGPNGLRCLVGCSTVSGSSASQLNSPQSLSFDIYGNIFVTDSGNQRVQILFLMANTCDEPTTLKQLPTTTQQVHTSTNKDRTSVIPTTIFAKSTALTTHKGGIFTTSQARGQSTSQARERTANPVFVSLQSTIMSTSENIKTTTFQTSSIMSTADMKNSFYSLMMRTSKIYETTSTTKVVIQSTETSTIQNFFPTPRDRTFRTMNITINNTISKPISFVPKNCSDPLKIGQECNVSSILCDMAKPCQHFGTCFYDTTSPEEYVCECLPGFNGSDCQHDIQVCKSITCWNNGTCSPSNNSFVCSCLPGWEGDHCEQKINYCQNITCLNYGICQSLLLGYKCECLSGLYFGEYCEQVAKFIIIRRYISKSSGSTAIIIICSFFIFVIALDILKYVFHIDVSKEEFQRIQRKKWEKRRKAHIQQKPTLAIRYVYVNKSSIQVINSTS